MIQVQPAAPDTLNTAGPFLQTPWWAAFKAGHGWSSLAFRVTWIRDSGETEFPLSVLLRRLPLGLGLAYVPHGPGEASFLAAPEFEDGLEALSLALKPHLPRGTICLRWDLLSGTRVAGGPGAEDEGVAVADPFPGPLGAPFRKPPADVQPPDTVIVALADEETLLARMHKKTRYNIRLAEKKGVTVEKAGVEALGEWYTLYRETAARDKISIHSEAYYRDLFSHAPDLSFWLARFEGKLLAGNVVLVHGTQAVYLYGASSNEHRNLMAPYALQWAAMVDSRNRGATEYDLFGIPPTDDPQHPMHGLYRFKNGFGGDRVHRHGAWDRVFRPGIWTLWTGLDALRIWYFKVWKKR
ncbi:MAG TPA: peptidoglycan bridge formation glycyltransferase FemA/FemB family protein [Spirochaetia bacterium]|nr:peptidoglycan bridge formation glycyltransferase FemA/FemB family protein [Spirochaetia bacterium]